jgi:predicted amidohydrolase
MLPFRVALLQLHPPDQEPGAAAARGEAACRRAKAFGADLALFPEMWSNGCRFFDPSIPGAREAWAARAEDRDGSFVSHFASLARELEMAIAITYLENWPGGPRNSVSLFDRWGAHVFTYAKMHTCDFDVERYLTSGDEFHVAALDTAIGPVQVGAMICYDREFPESARILMLKGAELILTPNACDLEINRLSQLRARAYENMTAIALANYPGDADFGHSTAFDGIAFRPDGRSRDMRVVEAGEGEGIFVAEFDLDALRDYRSRETWGNAYRRPHRYAALVDAGVAPPFIREDFDGTTYDCTAR